jgi:hypothetical protein
VDEIEAADGVLWTAWSDFCDQLKDIGRLVFDHNAPVTVQNRAAGFEYLARYLPKALDQKFNCADPLYPQLFLLQTPTSKSFGDNPDCTYHAGWVDGEHTYRIVGNRGSVKWVSFIVGRSAINNRELVSEWDGAFSITVGPEKADGNWLRTEPGLNRVFIRQFFGSWDEEEPMRLRIERIDLDGPPPPPTPEDVARRLQETVTWLKEDSQQWARFVDYYRPWPNQFVAGVPDWLDSGNDRINRDRSLTFCHWVVQRDEALVIRVRPPECFWWNFEMNNEWHNSVDYRYRLSSVNSVQAVTEADGTVVVVLSHVDPGVPNWLDAAGFTSGEINQRWVEAHDHPLPHAQLVKLDDLQPVLGPDVVRIDPAGRAEQLRRRKVGVDRRFSA